jgi:drug/metabolite transporter (DMT)-like permease
MVPLALGAIYIIWGSTYLAMRYMVESIPPIFSGGARYFLAGMLMLGYARLIEKRAWPTAQHWRGAAMLGALLFLVGNGGVVIGAQYVQSTSIAITIATMPLWAALFARLVGRRLQRLEWIGMALGLLGVVLLNLGSQAQAHYFGLGAIVISTIGWASGSVLLPRIVQPRGTMATAAQMLAGGALMLLVSVLLGEQPSIPTARSALAFVYLFVFGTLVAFSAYAYLLHRVSPALATSNAYVNPLVAVALGTTLGGESVAPTAVGALVVILLGVGLIAYSRWRTGA